MSKLPIDEIRTGENVLYQAHPSMFRNHPVWFVVSILLSLLGVGLFILIPWWLQSRATMLTVTDRKVSLRKGILSKSTNDVFHNDIRNIRVNQTFFQRLFDTGYIGISSSGQEGIEIEVNGLPEPRRVKEIIDQYR